MLERCGTIEDTNTTKAHPFSPVNKPQKYVHTPLSGGLEGAATKIFTLRVGASWTTLLEAPNKLLHTKNKLWGSFLKEICPRGNNNIVIIIFLVHDNVYTPCYNCIKRKRSTVV
jgi:AAA15 family ATPase/GTPase